MEHVSKPKQKSNVQTSYHENYVKSQQKGFVKNSNIQRCSQDNFQRSDFRENEQKIYHRVPYQNQFSNSQTVFPKKNVGYQK